MTLVFGAANLAGPALPDDRSWAIFRIRAGLPPAILRVLGGAGLCTLSCALLLPDRRKRLLRGASKHRPCGAQQKRCRAGQQPEWSMHIHKRHNSVRNSSAGRTSTAGTQTRPDHPAGSGYLRPFAAIEVYFDGPKMRSPI
jgi:hypothetical protein